MIINVTNGDPSATSRYIQGPAKSPSGRPIPGTEERATLIGSQGFGFPIRSQADVDLAIKIMERDAQLQSSRTNPIRHTAIHTSQSWHPGYTPSREEMQEVDEHIAKAMGWERARRITWHHNDKTAKDPETGEEVGRHHTHTLWGINAETGRAHPTNQRIERLIRAGMTWERDHDQITPARQRDHDIAGSAERSDHPRTMGLCMAPDGSIARRRLDRALSLGGHFGEDKAAQRAEFIEQNNLTRFPTNRRYSYSSPKLADEKRNYQRENKPHSDNLHKAYNREAKERVSGVGRLYEDHSFEKTSKPKDPAPQHHGEKAGMFGRVRRAIEDRAMERREQQHYQREYERRLANGTLPKIEDFDPATFDPKAAADHQEKVTKCKDCKQDVYGMGEAEYQVKDEIWKKAGMEPDGGKLCIGDLEKRLGRKLSKDDFDGSRATDQAHGKSERLNDRLGRDSSYRSHYDDLKPEVHNLFKAVNSVPHETREPKTVGFTNDFLDWPWKKAGEAIKKWRDERNYRGHVKDLDKAVQAAEDRERAGHNFGKQVEEKGWDHPVVRKQWEKLYDPDRQWRAAQGRSQEPSERYREERRDHPKRSVWDRLKGKDDLPPWEKEEARQETLLRQHGLDKAWAKAVGKDHQRQQDYPGQPNHPEPGEAADDIAKRWKREGQINQWERQQQERAPQQTQESRLSKWYKDQMAKPRPDRDQPLPPPLPKQASREVPSRQLPPPRESPMPKIDQNRKIEKIDRNHEAPQKSWPEVRFPGPSGPTIQERRADDIRRTWKTDEDKRNVDQRINDRVRGGAPSTNQQEPKPMPREPSSDRVHGFQVGKGGKTQPIDPAINPNRGAPFEASGRFVNGDWVPGKIDPKTKEENANLWKEARDGTAGQGRVDRTDAGRQGILPGGPHRPEPDFFRLPNGGLPPRDFRDILREKTKDIKPPPREQEKDRERER